MASYLSQEELQALEEERVILSPVVNGKRKVSAALLSPPSTQGSVSSGSSASVRIRPGNAQIPFDLPESSESVAAVEFCGFSRAKAGEIFERWAGKDPLDPNSLVDYMIGEVNRLNTELLALMSAPEAMTILGISQETQEALLDPEFAVLFRSEKLRFWLVDIVKGRDVTLESLLERLKLCAVETVRERKDRGKGKRAKVAGAFDHAGAGEASSSAPTSQQPGEMTAAILSTMSKVLPSTYTVVSGPPPTLPDHYVYYKGKSAAELHDGDDLILRNGSIDINAMLSDRGGDFNMFEYAWYFTKEGETAEQYRKFAARRHPKDESWNIRFHLPKSFVDGLNKKQLWFSTEWKEFVWYCRMKGKDEQGNPYPSKLDQYLPGSGTQLLEGHVCGSHNKVITIIKKEEVQQTFIKSHLLHNGNKQATQIVFIDNGLRVRLNELLRGNIYIEIFPVLDSTVNPGKSS